LKYVDHNYLPKKEEPMTPAKMILQQAKEEFNNILSGKPSIFDEELAEEWQKLKHKKPEAKRADWKPRPVKKKQYCMSCEKEAPEWYNYNDDECDRWCAKCLDKFF
jgi:hypothetical protein